MGPKQYLKKKKYIKFVFFPSLCLYKMSAKVCGSIKLVSRQSSMNSGTEYPQEDLF